MAGETSDKRTDTAKGPAKASVAATVQLGAPAAGIDPTAIIDVRGERVMLDEDIAAMFAVETRVFNQAFKRNQDRFPAAWVFQLTAAEMDDLRSRSVISSGTWGGRRTPPWAFSEHGVVLAASLLNSDRAKAAMVLVVDTFVRARRGELAGGQLTMAAARTAATAGGGAGVKLNQIIERLMSAMTDERAQRQVIDEAQEVFRQTIDHLKARLGRAGIESEKIAAEAAKLLAEAEATRAAAAKTRAEGEEIALRTLARKLSLAIEAEQAMARGEMQGFLKVLRRLGKA